MNLSCSEKVVAEVKLYFLWRRHDSNVRTTLRFDLQSNAFGHFATPPYFIWNHRLPRSSLVKDDSRRLLK